ncbi:hypothetical protein GHK46_07100 [Sinorhizobium medicae]|uniref:hypothetical protein n=1 Tax=Sinorhizobium medicae TaxID=110321 RepID=UPI001296D296|nr:hypothetical protein [Sinorhizobium medicae]MQV97188.1 hypothetical protein [Sinorhizobium medicae]
MCGIVEIRIERLKTTAQSPGEPRNNAPGRPEADIEDIFEPELFAAILNGTYDLNEGSELSADKLKEAIESTERLVKQAEAAFAVMPVDVPEFDHFTPAAWLIRNPKVLDAKTGAVRRPWTAPRRSSRPTTNCFGAAVRRKLASWPVQAVYAC